MRFSNLLAVVLFLGALGVSGMAFADSSTSLTGNYTLDADESDELSEVFEPALEDMGRIRRGIARRVLERQDGPGERMEIEEKDDAVRIDTSNEPTRTIPLDGQTVELTPATNRRGPSLSMVKRWNTKIAMAMSSNYAPVGKMEISSFTPILIGENTKACIN